MGYIHAVWRRARIDYIKTKESIPGLRSAKWVAWRSMVQRGAIAGVVVVALIAWLVAASLDQATR